MSIEFNQVKTCKYKVLVINFFGGIGDSILTIPFLQLLSTLPCEIYFVTRPSSPISSIVEKIPYIKEVILHPFVKSNFRYRYFGTLVKDLPHDMRFIWNLNAKGPFHLVFWIEYPLREPKRTGIYKCLLLSLLSSSWKACLTRGKLKKFPGMKVIQVDHSQFFPEQINKLLPVGITDDVERADLSFLLKEPPSPFVERVINITTPIIILHPFGYNAPFMRVPIEKWENIVKQIREVIPDSEIVLLGTSKDFQTELEKRQWEDVCRNYGLRELVDKTSLTDLSHLIKNCYIFIGQDSALSHFAWAFDKPRLIIYRSPAPYLPSVYYREEDNLFLFTPRLKCFPCGGDKAINCRSKTCIHSYDWAEISSTLKNLLATIS